MSIDWKVVPGAIWRSHQQRLRPIVDLDPVNLKDLIGIDTQRDALLQNTVRFARGESANNALLWGSRGTGKSALVKAVINVAVPHGVRVIQIDRDDLSLLPDIVEDHLRGHPFRFIVFCDDLSFAPGDNSYRGLKTVMEGSIELPASNVLVYATSNRRHLVSEFHSDNTGAQVVDTELHYSDEVEEKISLADRFGLWLSFYPITQAHYLAIVDHLFAGTAPAHGSDNVSGNDRPQGQAGSSSLHADALRFAQSKGGRSGRTAKQFFNSRRANSAHT
jgi:predicted AAA+ superfamily ATPase